MERKERALWAKLGWCFVCFFFNLVCVKVGWAAAWALLYVFLMLVKEGRGTVFVFAAAISGKASTL
jgi:hypothetical protein